MHSDAYITEDFAHAIQEERKVLIKAIVSLQTEQKRDNAGWSSCCACVFPRLLASWQRWGGQFDLSDRVATMMTTAEKASLKRYVSEFRLLLFYFIWALDDFCKQIFYTYMDDSRTRWANCSVLGAYLHENNTKSKQAYFLQVYCRTKRIYGICGSICYLIFNLDLQFIYYCPVHT